MRGPHDFSFQGSILYSSVEGFHSHLRQNSIRVWEEKKRSFHQEQLISIISWSETYRKTILAEFGYRENKNTGRQSQKFDSKNLSQWLAPVTNMLPLKF